MIYQYIKLFKVDQQKRIGTPLMQKQNSIEDLNNDDWCQPFQTLCPFQWTLQLNWVYGNYLGFS